MTIACDSRHVVGSRAAVDDSSWDGGAALSACASSDTPASCYGSICAGRKAGDPDKQSSHALPHHKAPGDPPNAAGVRNALSRLPQTQGLTNKAAAQAHLEAHMKAIAPDENKSDPPSGESRAAWDPDGDGDDDSTAAGDTDHSHWDEAGQPIAPTFLAAGRPVPTACPECGTFNDMGTAQCVSCGAQLETADDAGESGGTSSTLGYAWASGRPPRDNLIRARSGGVALRAAEGAPLGELYGVFSEYNRWYPVFGEWEGPFMERALPGSFVDTMANDRSGMRVLFDHGMDPHIGGKPLGPIADLRDSEEGPAYRVPLYNTGYNRDSILPLLEGELMNGEKVGSGLGSSMRFSVLEDQWNRRPKVTKRNPEAWPERSIVRARVYEFGPVTFPANEGATAAARSLTLEWQARLVGDPRFQADFVERVGAKVAERIMATIPEDLRTAMQPEADAIRNRQEWLRRRARVLLLTA